MRASAAWRGAGILPARIFSAAPARGPEMRTTAIAAGRRPEERAKMVSRCGSDIAAQVSAGEGVGQEEMSTGMTTALVTLSFVRVGRGNARSQSRVR